jgi:uncharacterized peroxidase-related enzyme
MHPASASRILSATTPDRPNEEPLMPFRKWIPDNARPGLLLKPHPESGELLMRLTEQLMRGPASLKPAHRELIAAYTSAVNACEFCYGAHAATAEALGVDERWLTRLIEDLERAQIDAKLKPILRFVRKLTRSPARVQQADVTAIFATGWDEDAFYHVVSICALFNYYNRLIDGYGVKSSPDYRKSVGKRLAEQGYSNVLEIPD